MPFAPGDLVVYPSHGVGRVVRIESQVIGTQETLLFVIVFEQDRMTLRVPMSKVGMTGLRSLSTPQVMEKALVALKSHPIKSRLNWNRRALACSVKINSGDPISIAEVVRDLHRRPSDSERSSSAGLIYEQARGRLTREVAAIERIEIEAANDKLELLLNAA
jgi:CarD family transcriptional regulator